MISTEALASALAGAAPPKVVDVRWRLGGPPGRQDYEVGHVPGAHYLDLDADLSSAPGAGGRHPLPSTEDLQRVLRSAGIRKGHPVVAYDAADGSVAARLWWLLRWAGHTEVAVLDGGFAAWVAEGRPVSKEIPTAEPGDITVTPGAMPVVDADEAAALARNGVLLDARAPQRYQGETEPVDPRAGHIPGALNAPSSGHVDSNGRWLGPTALAERFQALGARPDARVGAYCGSGVTASSVVLALEVAGITTPDKPAELYAGSWSHWCVDPSREVATGPTP
ncbi:thiosulfate/3-mercaptopyruvate sulfurtransferase [Saccharothrix tamanrassetensis]|uniref:Thiosulfate/3-mercaptopyruvate sulfurtransferase n=1 Tax=Saccharothrix tamanrassetensis TaxID=1051531 RepID=A0A841CV30_9PSEU|nr:thiosulfate/3-mercaptopyruvate sulfurtransferase [Saccharothrix tamanrassetensis]